MATDAKKHTSLAQGENPTRAAIAAAILSVNDVIPVANGTEANQVAAAVVAGGQNLATNPIVVARADARGLHRIEISYDGTTWLPASGELAFTSIGNANTWASANGALLVAGDECRIAGVPHRWSGSAWLGIRGAAVNPTYNAGVWAPHSIPLEFYLKADGEIGFDGGFQNVGAGTFNAGLAGAKVGDIPTAFRPGRTIAIPASQLLPGGTVQAHATVFVQANGEIYVSLSTTGTYGAGALNVFLGSGWRPA